MNEWMIKNALDQGAHGIIAPAHRDGRASPPPRPVDALSPTGRGRGHRAGRAARLRSRNAVRYWGVSGADYIAKADVWPLDPQGELLNMIQIENKLGIANVEEIAAVPG